MEICGRISFSGVNYAVLINNINCSGPSCHLAFAPFKSRNFSYVSRGNRRKITVFWKILKINHIPAESMVVLLR